METGALDLRLLLGRLMALPANIILGCTFLPEGIPLAYFAVVSMMKKKGLIILVPAVWQSI
jgi:hypothetical protein